MGSQGTWIPVNQRTTAWWIFNHLFMCRVSNIQTMSVEYIKQFGMPSSGVQQYDKETANELIIRPLSISQMADFYKNGVTVHVINIADTKEIYERITDHLNFWKERISISYHIKDAPVDDLLLLDKLANVVYVHAVPQFTTEIVDSILARGITSVMRVNRTNVLAAPMPKSINPIGDLPDQRTEVDSKKYPDRESMAEAFSKTRLTGAASHKWK